METEIRSKQWEVTVSGSFKTQVASDKDRFNFDGITGRIPMCEEVYIKPHAMRMLPMWVREDKKLKANFEGAIKVYVDNYTETEGEILCIGKNIKEMSWEELQWLACYKGLREIPLYKKGDLRAAREKAYERYEEVVNGKMVIKTVQQLKSFKEEMAQKGRFPEEIEKMLEKSFNMIIDRDNPTKSYNFAKTPAIIVK